MPASISTLAAKLGPLACRFDIDVLACCDSTNAVVLSRAEAGAPSGTVVITEEQTAGRGRRGRSWFASPGDSLTFSLLWRFAVGTAPAGLSLAVGVAVARALNRLLHGGTANLGAGGTALKWPNDILKDGRKLGGILVELVPGAPHAAVIGIGINLRLPAAMPKDVRVTSAVLGVAPEALDQNDMYAVLLEELLATLDSFAAGGFAVMRPEWMVRHAMQDARVSLSSDFAPPREGLCRGVDSDGALLLEVDGRIERILSGEVSLRPLESPELHAADGSSHDDEAR
ncbi:MAG: biotin--[acetyl-CoA-carboxylase] ligase [Burkholderiaceae bacterium]|nr:biotin--[acetyl-CoA-carboxylase] ligase [Sulfuritalea sp.]MCF8175276.1 biotin--[acetyl-CoA-carboxylase] ligase [Burkholderiaceae bacterium]